MKRLLKVRNTFFEGITEEQCIQIEREREKFKEKMFLILRILFFFLVSVYAVSVIRTPLEQ